MEVQKENCPNCKTLDGVGAELHPGTALVRCDVCGFRGPEVRPPVPDDISGAKSSDAAWNAWNTKVKSVRQGGQ